MELLQLTKSQEDYLEAIYILEQEKVEVRVKEIASFLQVKMPSVTGALKILSQKELIEHAKNSSVHLTATGRQIGQTINQKHQILQDFLIQILNLPKEASNKQACLIEHIIDINTASRIDNLNQFIKLNHSELINSKDWETTLTLEKI